MEDIRGIVQRALDSVFYGDVPVWPESRQMDEIPDEYITYTVTGGYMTRYANGLPVCRRDHIDVKWYGVSISQKQSRIEQAVNVLTAAGFRLVDGPADLDKESTDDYFGAAAELSLERVIKAGD